MEQYFGMARIFESRDMSIGNRDTNCIYIHEDKIHEGGEYNFFGCTLKVISINENEITFTFKDYTYTINRKWQILGTPSYDIPNMYIDKSERFVFFFSSPSGDWDWNDEYSEYIDLFEKMMDNAEEGEIWKNIPLARRWLHIIKDLAPERDDKITPALRAYGIELILKNDCISIKETPRLYQSFCEYYRLCRMWEKKEDFDAELEEHFDKYYFRTVDKHIYDLSWIVSRNMSGPGLDLWNHHSKYLKVDPVQASEEWEKHIYEVEKEVEEELKGEPRGMGFCYAYWSAKRAALARRDIDWRSPCSMNPGVMFD